MADRSQVDANFKGALIVAASTGVTSDGPVALWADKTTHRLLVDAGTITTSSASVGTTGSAVPTSADFIGLNVAGNLRGWTGVNPTGSVYAAQVDLASVGGTSIALGQGSMATSIPVVLASNQASVPVAATLTAETTKVIGTTRTLGNGGATVDATVGAGTAPANMFVVGAIYNSTEISPTTGQSFSLQADSKGRLRNVIMDAAGNTRGANVDASNRLSVTIDNIAAAQTLATVTTVTTVTNLGASNAAATIAADAVTPTVPGIAAYGFIKTPGANTWDRSYSIVNATNSTGTGISAVGIIGQFDDVSPTAITENQFGNLRMSTNRNLYNTIRDAAGNERGANVTASNELLVNVNNTVTVTATNLSTNIAQMNGVTVTMGNGIAGTGVQRVAIASDNSAVSGMGVGATGAAVPANAVYSGGIAQTSLPSAATAGNLTGMMVDKYQRQVMLAGTIRDLRATQTTTISASTSETTIVTAAASVFNDIVMLIFSNTSSTGTRIDIRDTTAGTILGSVYVPANDMRGFSIASEAIPQTTVNTNWTAQCGTSVTDIRVYVVYNKNK